MKSRRFNVHNTYREKPSLTNYPAEKYPIDDDQRAGKATSLFRVACSSMTSFLLL
jgi:hypothetical protein